MLSLKIIFRKFKSVAKPSNSIAYPKTACQWWDGFAMIRLPLKKTGKEAKKKACSASGNTFRKSNQRLRDLAEKKEGVDGNKKVLHNLISLVL
ncbi:MAG: hypothetical protein Q7J77_09940, partial [Undibacterium sp.]|nr:hypothetical protein [Undibacterium sp.]